MTIDEHMCLRSLLMHVRDELAEQARRDPQAHAYVDEVTACLAILNRPHIRGTLTVAKEHADEP